MQGLSIINTKESINFCFNKKFYNEDTLSDWLKFIEIENLAKRIDFDEEIMDLADEIKNAVWQKEKVRLGFD